MRILVAEDEARLAETVARGLRNHGMAVDIAYDGAEALVKAEVNEYDIVLLDRDLPHVHGDEVCRELIDAGNPARILMLTAARSIDERVDGLNLGADDYLSKPFDFAELVARINALMRRPAAPAATILEHGDIRLDPARRTATRRDSDLALSRKEFGVLEVLLRADGAAVSSEELLEKVWDESIDPFTNVVRVTVMTLRRKLGDPPVIETVTGVGYRM